jgi:hypothetical protein
METTPKLDSNSKPLGYTTEVVPTKGEQPINTKDGRRKIRRTVKPFA